MIGIGLAFITLGIEYWFYRYKALESRVWSGDSRQQTVTSKIDSNVVINALMQVSNFKETFQEKKMRFGPTESDGKYK